jgi:hypothetical protein
MEVSTTFLGPAPGTGKLSLDTFADFADQHSHNLLDGGEAGREILQGTEIVLPYPELEDVFRDAAGQPMTEASPNSSSLRRQIRKYPLLDDGTRAPATYNLLEKNRQVWKVEMTALRASRAAMIHRLRCSCGFDSLVRLQNEPGHTAAYASGSSFLINNLLTMSHSKASALQAVERMRVAFSLDQNTDSSLSYEHFISKLHQYEVYLASDFGSDAHPGFIKIEHLIAAIFLKGVHKTAFQFPLHSTLSNAKDARFDKFWSDIAPVFTKFSTHCKPSAAEPIAGFSSICHTDVLLASGAPTGPIAQQQKAYSELKIW